MSQTHNRRPSEILGIDDTYLSFCMDEACDYIVKKNRDGAVMVWDHTPKVKQKDGTVKQTTTSIRDLYASIGADNVTID